MLCGNMNLLIKLFRYISVVIIVKIFKYYSCDSDPWKYLASKIYSKDQECITLKERTEAKCGFYNAVYGISRYVEFRLLDSEEELKHGDITYNIKSKNWEVIPDIQEGTLVGDYTIYIRRI